MSNFNESQVLREKAGQPTGGQFAEKEKGASGLALAGSDPWQSGPPADAELGLFELDDVPDLLGYDSGTEWNGFAVPWLTEQSLERIARHTAQLREDDSEAPLLFKDADTGVWMIDEGECFDASPEAPRIHPVDEGRGPGGVKVYALDGWTFQDAEDWSQEEVEQLAQEEQDHYLHAAKATSAILDGDGEMGEVPDNAEWDETAREHAWNDLTDFIASNQHLIRAARAVDPDYARNPGQIGHDFWLTRNGHGAGFWDRGLGDVGDQLSEAARAHGAMDAYLGDDGDLYLE